jgi:predicted nucleotidyltransferase
MDRWRELLEERLEETVASLGSAPGVRGLVIGGSVGRGEPWPLSDIDVLPIVAATPEAGAEIERRRAALVDWWAASGRAQTLDVGWLAFTAAEVEQAVRSGPAHLMEKMPDLRWFHGTDKAFGGRGAADPDGLAEDFAQWVTAVRFDRGVVAARVREWRRQTMEARDNAVEAVGRADPVRATLGMRQAARALRLVLIEGWGERLGSMGREWTRFERMAERRGASALAARCARLAGAAVEDASTRARLAPAWLRERIDLAYQARLAVGEEVTAEENARDQVAAFAVHVTRRRPEPWGDWAGVPASSLGETLEELDCLIAEVDLHVNSAPSGRH